MAAFSSGNTDEAIHDIFEYLTPQQKKMQDAWPLVSDFFHQRISDIKTSDSERISQLVVFRQILSLSTTTSAWRQCMGF